MINQSAEIHTRIHEANIQNVPSPSFMYLYVPLKTSLLRYFAGKWDPSAHSECRGLPGCAYVSGSKPWTLGPGRSVSCLLPTIGSQANQLAPMALCFLSLEGRSWGSLGFLPALYGREDKMAAYTGLCPTWHQIRVLIPTPSLTGCVTLANPFTFLIIGFSL